MWDTNPVTAEATVDLLLKMFIQTQIMSTPSENGVVQATSRIFMVSAIGSVIDEFIIRLVDC